MNKPLKASIGFGFGGEDWQQAVDFAVEAERLGVDSVWFAEAWGSDAVSPLAFVAARTSKIRLGTGIMQAGTRTPALVGMTAATLSVLTGGRFLLGLGTSGPQVRWTLLPAATERPLLPGIHPSTPHHRSVVSTQRRRPLVGFCGAS